MSRNKKRTRAGSWESADLNNVTFIDWFDRLRAIATNRFEWINLPDTVNERFIEQGLFNRGSMLWFEDSVIGQLCLEYTAMGPFNLYDIPIMRNAFSSNGFSQDRNDKDSVIIWNNYNRKSDFSTTQLFALRIADIQRTIDVNIKGQKTPKIITGPESQRLAMQNLFMQWDGNEPFMFGHKNMREELEISVLDSTAPYVADKLEIQKHMMINEYLTYLGVENSNQDKKERLVANEVASNYGMVENSRNVALNARQQACDEINKMFGLNINVRFKSNVDTTVNALGGKQDG